MLMTRPPGKKTEVSCEDCGSSTFQIILETYDGQVSAFHTRCANCGTKGEMVVTVQTKVTKEFVQFEQSPEDEGPTLTFYE